jgi:putative ABC transport system permease protein
MMLLEPVRIGLDQLRLHKMRAFLSILGILISVGSVTGVVSMGDGLRNTVMRQFQAMGSANQINVRPPSSHERIGNSWVQRNWDEHLTNDDLERFNSLPNVSFIVPIIEGNVTARYGRVSAGASFIGSNEFYPRTQNWNLEKGRNISEDDVRYASKVAVIGSVLADDLYGDTDPIDQEVGIEGTRVSVIGVIDTEAKFGGNTDARYLIVPYTAFQRRYQGDDYLARIMVVTDSPGDIPSVERGIRRLLARHHGHADEYIIRTGESDIENFNNVVTVLKIAAGGIAAISLIVGGIGIMNIMLVSVNERTREIGLRKAIGATRSAIMGQFIMEAVVMCLFGGALGILLGSSIGFGVGGYIQRLTDLPFKSIMTPGLMAFGVLYSAGIGVFFGVYPAWRASRLDPVDALRYE